MSGVQSNAKLKHVSGSAEPESPLLDCLHTVTRLHAKPISKSALLAGVPLPDGQFGPAEFVRAAEAHGYSAKVTRRRLSRISPLLLPVTLLMNDGSACVLTAIKPRQVYEVIFPEADFGAKEISAGDLADSYSGFALFAQPELAVSQDLNSPLERKRWSWFWGTLAAYFPYYIEALIAGVIVNVLTIASALYIMNVYDRVVPNNAFETLIVLAVGTATAIVFEFCARTLRAYFLDAAGRRADVGLASQIFAQAMGLSMISRPTSTGAFAAQLREFESVREFITSATLTAVMDIPFVLFFIFIVSLIGGPLYLIPAGALPLILIVGLIAQFPLAIVMKRNLEEIARRHGLLIESLEGVETLKANRGESQMLGKYEDYTALSSRSANRARTISSAVVHFTTMVLQLVSVAMVFWGVYLIADGELTVGALIACVILIGRGLAPLQQVASLMMRYQQARASYFTLSNLMRQPVERERGQLFTARGSIAGALKFDAVTFAYPGAGSDTLKGINFSIAAGERVGLLGRMGSGKSTLLRVAGGFYPASAGTVCIDDVDISQFDPAELRQQLGFVAQEPHLFMGTLRENIALGAPHAEDSDILEAARIAGLESMIAGHPDGLQRLIGERGQGLSGGQRQAVANARAILVGHRILLLDEPTSAMDHTAESRFIQEMNASLQGRTLLLVTHKPSMLALVQRIVVIEAGQVAMDGPRDDVLRKLSAPNVKPVGQG